MGCSGLQVLRHLLRHKMDSPSRRLRHADRTFALMALLFRSVQVAAGVQEANMKTHHCICKHCCENFNADRPTRSFCSHLCYSLQKKKKETRCCKQCGKAFQTVASSTSYCCSRKCGCMFAAKGKRIEKTCKKCGKIMFVVLALQNRKNYCSRVCYTSHKSTLVKGKNNPAYKNGSSYEKRGYRGDGWDQIRLNIYKRDNFTCQKCGEKCISKKSATKENSGKIIQCHHKVPYRISFDNRDSNLVTLCLSCHLCEEQKCQ